MGAYDHRKMSFGPAMSMAQMGAATLGTLGLCYIQHQSTLQSGLQPTTVSGEWAAASVHYRLNHKLESNEDKTFICDPIKHTMADSETGRAEKWATFSKDKNPWDP